MIKRYFMNFKCVSGYSNDLNYQQLFALLSNKMTQQTSFDLSSLKNHKGSYILAAALLLGTVAWRYSSKRTKQKLQKKKDEAKNKSILQDSTIILAFQPEDFFIKLRNKDHQQFKEFKKVNTGILNKIGNIFKKQSFFYEEMIPGKKLRSLFKSLKKNEDVKLMIYTKIQRQFCNYILKNFGLQTFFQQKNIVIMQSQHKSADQLSHDTRGVVVISAKREDHQSQSIMGNNHNLILKINEEGHIDEELLDKLRTFLLKLVQIGRSDNFHEVMHELAIDMNLPLVTDQL